MVKAERKAIDGNGHTFKALSTVTRTEIANLVPPAPQKKKPRRTGGLDRGFWVLMGDLV